MDEGTAFMFVPLKSNSLRNLGRFGNMPMDVKPDRLRNLKDFILHMLLGRLIRSLQFWRSKDLSLSRDSIDEGSSLIAAHPFKTKSLIFQDSSGSFSSFEKHLRFRKLSLSLYWKDEGSLSRLLQYLRVRVSKFEAWGRSGIWIKCIEWLRSIFLNFLRCWND